MSLSVVMPHYNHGRYLSKSLGALLQQSYEPAEIIVIDDASTDGSDEVLAEIGRREPRIRVERNARNIGMSANLDRALSLATSDYVYFAAADDWVLPGLFEKSMALLMAQPAAALCSALTRVTDEEGRDAGVLATPIVRTTPGYVTPAEVRHILLCIGNWIQGNAAVYRREALIRAGAFHPELHAYLDHFIAQALALEHGACFIPEPLAVFRRMRGGFSGRVQASETLMKEIEVNGRRLMETQYRTVFPARYPDLWSRDRRFEAARVRAARRLAVLGPGELRAGGGGERRWGWDHAGRRAAFIVLALMAAVRERPWLALRRILVRVSQSRRLSRYLVGRLLGLPR
jgi:glycosyltransferase involved in cell wall biosynthesis